MSNLPTILGPLPPVRTLTFYGNPSQGRGVKRPRNPSVKHSSGKESTTRGAWGGALDVERGWVEEIFGKD